MLIQVVPTAIEQVERMLSILLIAREPLLSHSNIAAPGKSSREGIARSLLAIPGKSESLAAAALPVLDALCPWRVLGISKHSRLGLKTD